MSTIIVGFAIPCELDICSRADRDLGHGKFATGVPQDGQVAVLRLLHPSSGEQLLKVVCGTEDEAVQAMQEAMRGYLYAETISQSQTQHSLTQLRQMQEERDSILALLGIHGPTPGNPQMDFNLLATLRNRLEPKPTSPSKPHGLLKYFNLRKDRHGKA